MSWLEILAHRYRTIPADTQQRIAFALTAAATKSVRTLRELRKPGTPPRT